MFIYLVSINTIIIIWGKKYNKISEGIKIGNQLLYQIAYIADYNVKNNKLTEYVETTNIKSEDYGALIERHKALIEKTGELEGLKFRKFSFTQFLNLVFLADLDDYVYDFKEINDI